MALNRRQGPVEQPPKGDHKLLVSHMLTLREVEIEGQQVVLRNTGCGSGQNQHDWSRCRQDVAGEDAYQFCIDCGRVRRAPQWFTRTK